MKMFRLMFCLLAFFLPVFVLAADGDAPPPVVIETNYWAFVIPFLTPLVIALVVRRLFPKIPTGWYPIIAPMLGVASDAINAGLTSVHGNPALGAGLGLLGVGVRELLTQIAAGKLAPSANVVKMLAFVMILPLSGCVTRPTVPGQPPPAPVASEFLALAAPLAEGFATAMLANNPKYAPVICGVADGLALALQQTELTPIMVDEFTRKLRADHPELDPNSYSLIRVFLIGTYDIWRRRYGPVIPSDPQAAEVIAKLQEILRNACLNVRPPG